mgnify:CR=1 FL=1
MRKHISVRIETSRKLEEIMREKPFLTSYDSVIGYLIDFYEKHKEVGKSG